MNCKLNVLQGVHIMFTKDITALFSYLCHVARGYKDLFLEFCSMLHRLEILSCLEIYHLCTPAAVLIMQFL